MELSDHSRMLCRISDMDGTRYSTIPPLRQCFSATCRDARVLPVPQAMMSCPLSCSARPFTTSETAASWWGRSSLGRRAESFGNPPQSTPLSRK